jgi:hypothetical protein
MAEDLIVTDLSALNPTESCRFFDIPSNIDRGIFILTPLLR